MEDCFEYTSNASTVCQKCTEGRKVVQIVPAARPAPLLPALEPVVSFHRPMPQLLQLPEILPEILPLPLLRPILLPPMVAPPKLGLLTQKQTKLPRTKFTRTNKQHLASFLA